MVELAGAARRGRVARIVRSQPESGQQHAGALDELRGITSSSSNPTLAAVARIDLASALRAKATETGTVDTAALQDSINALKPVLDDRSLSPGITGAAGLSMATSYESLGQFDEAERTYKILQDEQRFAGTGYPAAAADRLKTLAELRNPVTFVAGLPPQEPPPGAAMTPDALAGPPLSLTPPAGAPQASQQPAASGEPAAEGGATGGDSEPGAPATQPSGSQGP